MRLFSSIIAILLLLPVAKAGAVLGGSIDSFEMDAKSLRANNKRIPKISLPLYSIHEIESDSVHLKEYVSQDGIVFAITWDGNRHPDLEPLLGGYVREYREADATAPRKRGVRNRVLFSQKLRVQTFGHMRHLRGRIFDPKLFPKGVSVHDLE